MTLKKFLPPERVKLELFFSHIFGASLLCFVVLPAPAWASLGEKSQGDLLSACLIPPEALALWSPARVAPLIFHS